MKGAISPVAAGNFRFRPLALLVAFLSLVLLVLLALGRPAEAQNFFASWGAKPGFSGGYRESFNMGRK